ncbi:MAG TPA: oxidoreductase [Myxococcaceae bacterium]|nr:oxidoreductase [Myxococcaceae bacterium]
MKDVSFRITAGLLTAVALLVLGCGPGVQGTDSASSEQEALHSGKGPKLTPQNSGTTAGLIAISALNARVAWASGRAGTFARTTDGGKTWHAGVVPGAETFQFRDVQAVSENVAYLLSIPITAPSRIYKTVDGGQTWTLQFEAATLDFFYDCFAFWDPRSAVVLGDSINGRLPVLRTLNGTTWQDIGDNLPPPLTGEAGFASGGTCAATQGHRRAWLTTGAPPQTAGGSGTARVFFTTDRGQTWGVTTAPIFAGVDGAGGGFSIAFRSARHGFLAGGDLAATGVVDNFARSSDGGRTWERATPAPIPGAIFTAAYAGHGRGGHDDDDQGEDEDGHGHHGGSIRVVATAPTGTAWSPDEGRSWKLLEGVTGFWGVDFGSQQTGWLVGVNGTITRIDF